MKLGKKIVVVGISASGKTTFSKKLSEKIGIPLVLMDAIMWKPGWNYIGDVKTAQKLDELSSKPEWIIEGYITRAARTIIFERADTIIYLDYPRIVASCRYIKRWWKHRKNARPELKGSPEKFSFKFLKLVWTKGEAKSLNKFLSEVKNQDKIIIIHSQSEANTLLQI